MREGFEIMEDLFVWGVIWLLCGRLGYSRYLDMNPPERDVPYADEAEEADARRQQRNEMWMFTLVGGALLFIVMIIGEGIDSKIRMRQKKRLGL
jgi:hypothetical protein